MNKYDTVITGGGLSGLITAIALRSMGYGGSILVAEQNSYPFKENNAFIITPIARQLFRYLPLYKKHNYCEGRYSVYKLVNKKYNLCFEIPDTAITGYSDFICVLYEIAMNNNIDIRQETKALDYNFNDKYIVAEKGEIYFENIVIAEGLRENSKYQKFTEGDLEEYNFSIYDSVHKFGNVKNNSAIFVGDAGGFRDLFTDINCTYSILSAIGAAENIYRGKPVNDYYSDVKYLSNDIEASEKLKARLSEFGLLKNVLMGIRTYLSYL